MHLYNMHSAEIILLKVWNRWKIKLIGFTTGIYAKIKIEVLK